MQKVTMYCTAVCPYCVRAEQLLHARGVAEIEKIRVDLEPELRIAMVEKTGRRTVPQIYIGTYHVGGYDDLAALDHKDKLVGLLADNQ
ncbi:MAG: glutaredoxin 3 [Nitrosomonadales bacterium]|nr:glutaredoxin 3 [Nitrosomonadales bacterium]